MEPLPEDQGGFMTRRRSSHKTWVSRASGFSENASFGFYTDENHDFPPLQVQKSRLEKKRSSQLVQPSENEGFVHHIPQCSTPRDQNNVLEPLGLRPGRFSVDCFPPELASLFFHRSMTRVSIQEESSGQIPIPRDSTAQASGSLTNTTEETRSPKTQAESRTTPSQCKLDSLLRSIKPTEVHQICSKPYSFIIQSRLRYQTFQKGANADAANKSDKTGVFTGISEQKQRAIVSVGCLTKCLCRLLAGKPVEAKEADNMTHWELRLLQHLAVAARFGGCSQKADESIEQNKENPSKTKPPPDQNAPENFMTNIHTLQQAYIHSSKRKEAYIQFMNSRRKNMTAAQAQTNDHFKIKKLTAQQKLQILEEYKGQRYGKVCKYLIKLLSKFKDGKFEYVDRTVFAWSDSQIRKALSYS